jgi:tRNA-dihydrouridine synthase
MDGQGFWKNLYARERPVLALSPMDGVTDAAFRYMVGKYGTRDYNKDSPSSFAVPSRASLGSPVKDCPWGVDVLFTEFVSVDALAHAHEARSVERIMHAFIRARDVATWQGMADTPWPYEVAQVFGHTPELFYQAAVIIATLGFDGMDINMGCPAKNVAEQGSGAGLIRTPAVAQAIVRAAKAGMTDWAEGKVGIDDLSCSEAVKAWVRMHMPKEDSPFGCRRAQLELHSGFPVKESPLGRKPAGTREALPVSVKTRIGVDRDVAEAWMETLMEVAPATISLHGRTLKQLYEGQADWEAIARAARVVHARGGHILGNGDVGSVRSAQDAVRRYGVDGVLIGRAAEGNPGIFNHKSQINKFANREPSREQRLAWAVEHARVYEQLFGQGLGEEERARASWFMPVRKHLAWYCHGFPGAVELRTWLMRVTSAREVEIIAATELDDSIALLPNDLTLRG